MKKTYLLIGLSGSGKSTLGNCILNNEADVHSISNKPFRTSNNASRCTLNYQIEQNNSFIVIDTLSFNGDPILTKEKNVLIDLKKALEKVDYKIDCVLFLTKQGRITNEDINFVKFYQEKVFDKKIVKNSILIFAGNKTILNSKEIEKTFLANYFNGLSFDFNIKFDDFQDTEQDKLKNLDKRKNCINLLLKFLNENTSNQIDLTSTLKRADFISKENFFNRILGKFFVMNFNFKSYLYAIPFLAALFFSLYQTFNIKKII
jgi:GTPase Era involved in 16S rRNA processing